VSTRREHVPATTGRASGRAAATRAARAGRPAPTTEPPEERDKARHARPEPSLPFVDDLDALSAPPLHAKAHPTQDMDEAMPSLDDADRAHAHHPQDAGVAVDFEVDPESADAAADLAGDFGAQFLEGATLGEDVSERAIEHADEGATELPYVLEPTEETSSEEAPEPRAAERPAGRATAPRRKHARR
jgi:hypothetical protein